VITAYDVPGAGTGPGQGTLGGGFAANGAVMGNYYDADSLSHGFLLDKNGVFTTVDTPSAGTGPGQGPFPLESVRMERSQGWYLDEADVFTASCAIHTATSLSSTFQVRDEARARSASLRHCSDGAVLEVT
jgi:hypothetical protein